MTSGDNKEDFGKLYLIGNRYKTHNIGKAWINIVLISLLPNYFKEL